MKQRILTAGAAIVAFAMPHLAMAAAAAGTMPYSGTMTTFRGSLTGEIAGIICLIAVIGGVYLYINGSGMNQLLDSVVKIIIGVAIIGGAATFISTLGATGAVI